MKSIRKSRGSGFINDPLHIETGNPTSVLGSLTLLIIKMGGDCNDSALDLPSQMTLGSQFQLRQNHSRNFFWTKFLLLPSPLHNNFGFSMGISLNDLERKGLDLFGSDRISERAANDALYVVDSVARVGCHLRFGGGSDEFTFGSEGHPRGHCAARGGFNDLHFGGSFVPACDAGEGGSWR
mmetsp:Transcript_13148/g.26826  ORF Transcript_13148/g.26826 Transcript_13148/m.26826 type:complete len:181 (-) Transcript_13148:30-572(-)